jgi:hypothetical protein
MSSPGRVSAAQDGGLLLRRTYDDWLDSGRYACNPRSRQRDFARAEQQPGAMADRRLGRAGSFAFVAVFSE